MKKGYITNSTTQDGFGARMQRTIETMAYFFYLRDSSGLNIEYVHTPFAFEGFGEDFSMQEAARALGDNKYPYDEINREGYLKRAILWDNRMNYKGIKITDINYDNIKIVDSNKLRVDVGNKEIENKLYFVKYARKEINPIIDIISTYYPQIKEKFLFITPTDNNDIIVHIRRKDAINFGASRYLEDEYYLDVLGNLKSIKNKYNITIHTQRKGFDSSKYLGWEIIYDDEEEDYDLFVKMVDAKVLIVGKSSFSIAAAYLNQNIVVYPQQPTKGLSRFINKEQFKQLNL